MATLPHLPPDDGGLRNRLGELIAAGRLPSRPVRVWCGAGSHGPCALCGIAIGPAEVEFELDWPGTPLLHAACEKTLRSAMR